MPRRKEAQKKLLSLLEQSWGVRRPCLAEDVAPVGDLKRPCVPDDEPARQRRYYQFLVEEYRNRSDETRSLFGTIVQVFGLGLTVFTGAVAVITVTKGSPPEEFYWLAPLVLLLLTVALLQPYIRLAITIRYLKYLEEQIETWTGSSIFRLERIVDRNLMNFATASGVYRAAIFLGFAGTITVFAGLVALSARNLGLGPIHEHSYMIVLCTVWQVAVLGLAAWMWIGAFYRVETDFDAWIRRERP
jgi:hypothetical protein